MELHLRGKSVAITGASKGIGAAIAESFAEEGADLHLIARSANDLQIHVTRLREQHGIRVQIHACDLRNPEALTTLASELGDLDILVNNAGDIPGGSLLAVDYGAWRRGWELKVFGYITLSRTIYERMHARSMGTIINIIGMAGERVDFDYIAGSTGNAALMAFTRALGSRSLDNNVRVVGINPGPVETSRILTLMQAKAQERFGDANRYRELMGHWPRGRAATPREIADSAVFLSSDRSSYTSGAIINIDGGLSSRGGF